MKADSRLIYHPALFFDPSRGIASIGIIDAKGRPFLIILEKGKPPRQRDAAEASKSGDVYPAPIDYHPLADRWDTEDVTDFLKDPTAGWDFLDFRSTLEMIRAELEHYTDFLEPAHSTLVSCWIMATYFYPLFPAPRWTPENRPVVDGSKPASGARAPSMRGFYRIAP